MMKEESIKIDKKHYKIIQNIGKTTVCVRRPFYGRPLGRVGGQPGIRTRDVMLSGAVFYHWTILAF